MLTPPEPPIDDLLFQSHDGEGILTVKVIAAKDLRKPVTWFSKKSDDNAEAVSITTPAAVSTVLPMIKYDTEAASKFYTEKSKLREPNKKLTPFIKEVDHKVPSGGVALSAENIDKLGKSGPLTSPKPGGGYDLDEAKSYCSVNYHHTPARIQKLEEIGKEAAVRLHNDNDLKDAEKNRTISLYDLKKRHLESKASVEATGDPGILRRKTKAGGTTVSKNELATDPETMIYLGNPCFRMRTINMNCVLTCRLLIGLSKISESGEFVADIEKKDRLFKTGGVDPSWYLQPGRSYEGFLFFLCIHM